MGFRLVRSTRLLISIACGLVCALTVLIWAMVHFRAREDSGTVADRPPLEIVAGRPRLELDDTHRDLGIITPTEKVSLEYRLRNVGTKELVISNLRSSCGCAPATVDKNPVPAGKEAIIAVSFRAPVAAGLVGHSVLFGTNDPDHAVVQLGFQVMVQRPVEAAPPNLYVGAVMCGQSVIHDLELCTTAGDAFAITEIRPSVPWIRAEPVAGSARHRRRFRVTIDGKSKPGKFSESLQFHTTYAKQELVVVPITGEMVVGFKINPSRLLLGSALTAAVIDTQLIVTEFAPGRAPVDSVAIAGKDWQVVAWKAEKKSATITLIRLKIRVPETAGYKRTTLQLRSGARSEPHEIPLSCLVQGARTAGNQEKVSQK